MFEQLANAGKGFARNSLRLLPRSLRSIATPPETLVLAYHRVFAAASDPHGICVSPENFRAQLKYLCENYKVDRLSTLTESLRSGVVPRDSIVITFDDGYLDNLKYAKAILDEFRSPATMFVIAGEVGRNRRFGWDELSHLVLGPAQVSGDLVVTCRGTTRRWLRRLASDGERWSVDGCGPPPGAAAGSRLDLHDQLHTLIRSFSEEDRWSVLRELRAWSGTREDAPPEGRPMTGDELRRFEEGGRLEVGLHTLTHPVLAGISSAQQKTEIFEGKKLLEDFLGHPVRSFAYPYGAHCDFTSDTIQWVGEAGLDCACTTMDGTVNASTGPYAIPRVEIRNWGVDEFVRHLDPYLG
jgi:peptidoglycan/xylan/chitin deacetylase (PgdA/CDA1 family)